MSYMLLYWDLHRQAGCCNKRESKHIACHMVRITHHALWRSRVKQGLGSFYGVGLGLAVDEVAVPTHPKGGEGGHAGGGGGGGGKGGSGNGDKDGGPVTCLKGISASAWNPPPPQRRMVGDLMYLEVGAVPHRSAVKSAVQ